MSDVRAENEEGKKGGGYLKRVEIKLQIFLRRSRKRGFWRGKREIGGFWRGDRKIGEGLKERVEVNKKERQKWGRAGKQQLMTASLLSLGLLTSSNYSPNTHLELLSLRGLQLQSLFSFHINVTVIFPPNCFVAKISRR